MRPKISEKPKPLKIKFASLADNPLDCSIGTVLVTIPTIEEITSPSARLQVQNFREVIPLRKDRPGTFSRRASLLPDWAPAAPGTLNHSRISGSSTSRLSKARIMNAARQSHWPIPQAINGGMVAAVMPVPDNPIARASPRLRSYHRLSNWVQVTASAPMPRMGSAAKAKYSDQIDPVSNVVAR